MFQLIYASRALSAWHAADLQRLLRHAWRTNTERQVTGLLVYNAGNFLQVLEGEQNVVEDLFARIAADERHTDVQVVAQQDVAERHYAQWSMGSVHLEEIAPIDVWTTAQFATIAESAGLEAEAVVRWFERVVERHRAVIRSYAS